MELKLRNFLEEARTTKGQPYTHTSRGTGDLEGGWPSGSYFIPPERKRDFQILYCNAVIKGSMPTITEKPGAYFPLRVDFDFKSSIEKGTKRQYDYDIIKTIVGFYQEEIKNVVEKDENDCFDERILHCIVLEKPAPRVEGDFVKDGFHLHFPFFICDSWLQDIYFREKITEKMIESKVWRNSDYKTKVSEFIDTDMGTKVWMMYGSVNYKTKKSVPYGYKKAKDVRYGYAFDNYLDEVTLDDIFCEEMEEKKSQGKKNKVEYYLPMFLSIQGFRKGCPLIQVLQERSHSYPKRKTRTVPLTRRLEEITADLKLIRDELIDMVSDDRADNGKEWYRLGQILYDIGQGSEDALDIWINFSRRSNKFKDGECSELWDTKFKMGNSTIGSIMRFAKIDSPDQYKDWKGTNVKSALYESLYEPKPCELDVAKVVCKMFSDRFICANGDKDIWYEYSNHRWRQMQDCIEFKKIIVEDVVSAYADLKREIMSKMGDCEHDIDKDTRSKKGEVTDDNKESHVELKDMVAKKKKCSEIISALKTCGFLDKVIRMCKIYMHSHNFMKMRDENKMLFGCENGVLDLELLTFRDGSPDDYRTFTSGINYYTYREDDDEVKELDKYMEEVYPDEKLRNYFYDFFGTCLQGGNENKRVLFMIGGRDGAKSMTNTLLGNTFGIEEDGYFGKFPRELFVQATGKTSSAGARPELAQVRGKRLMGGQELTAHEKLNIGFVKEASGNDVFYTRNMYEKGSNIKPQHTMIVQLNEGPGVEGEDDAFWSRIRLIDHESKFVKPQDLRNYPVPETREEQLEKHIFHADPAFGGRIHHLAPVLLWRLFERYKQYRAKGNVLEEPDRVVQSTDKYRTSNDKYDRFVKERLVQVKDQREAASVWIKMSDAVLEYEDFMRTEYPYLQAKIGKDVFKKNMQRKIGNVEKKKVYGVSESGTKICGYRIAQLDEGRNEDVEYDSEEEPKMNDLADKKERRESRGFKQLGK